MGANYIEKDSGESTIFLNIADWVAYIASNIGIKINDEIIFLGIHYANKTGNQTSTTPNLDTTNWRLLRPTFDYMALSLSYTPTGSEPIGSSWYNQAEETIDVKISNDTTGQLFEEAFTAGQNDTGDILGNGTVATYDLAIGNSGNFRIKHSVASASEHPLATIGIITADIANTKSGKITTRGKVRGIQTDGANYGEVWVDSIPVYKSSTIAGGLTMVPPNAPIPAIPLAVVINAHATNGTLFVRPSFPESLVGLSDVNGTPVTVSGQLPVWDETNKYFDFTENINNYIKNGAINPTLNGLTLTDDLVISAGKTVDGRNISEDGLALDGKLDASEKGIANGVAELGPDQKVPLSQIPVEVQGSIKVVGTWNADTNIPDLSALTPTDGTAYQVSDPGNTNLNGETNWKAKDLAIYYATSNWSKLDNTDDVFSVNGKTGLVVINPDDLDDSVTSNKFTTQAEIDKLAGIENGATADQTDLEIKTAYENNANTNEFNDAEKSKLTGIAPGAEVNVQTDWDQTNNILDDYLKNKPVTITEQQATEIADNTVSRIDLETYKYASVVPDPTLWGKGNDNATVITPEIGPTGTIIGTNSYAPVKFDNGMMATAANGAVRYSNAIVVPNDNTFIIEAWIKFSVSSADWNTNNYAEVLWSNRAVAGSHGIYLLIGSDAGLDFYIGGTGGLNKLFEVAPSWSAGEEVYIVSVWDNTASFDGAKTGAIYWNETQIGSTTIVDTIVTPNTNFDFMGWNGIQGLQHVHIDNYKVYDQVSAPIISGILNNMETEGLPEKVLMQFPTNQSINLGDNAEGEIYSDGTDIVIDPKLGKTLFKKNIAIGDSITVGEDNLGKVNTDTHDLFMVNKDGVVSILMRGNNSQNAIVIGNFNADGAFQKVNINAGAGAIDIAFSIANGYQFNTAGRNRDFICRKRDDRIMSLSPFTVSANVATFIEIDHGFETNESCIVSDSTNAGSLPNATYITTRIDENSYTLTGAGVDGSGTATTVYTPPLSFANWLFYDAGADTLKLDVPTTISKDLLFSSPGSGLLFGNIYAYDQVTNTTFVGTGKGNKSQITIFTTNGVSNGCTNSADNDDITVLTDGIYDIDVHCTLESTVAVSADIGMSIYINNGTTEQQACHFNRRLSGVLDKGSAGMHAPIALSANDTVEVWVWNETNSNAILISDMSLTIKQIGA